MNEKLFDFAEKAKNLTFGWRKLGVLIGILAALFVWLYLNTMQTANAVIVPDLPANLRDTILGLFGIFAGANWAGKREKRLGSGEPS